MKMKKMLSFLLAVVMVVSMLPVSAFAAEGTEYTGEIEAEAVTETPNEEKPAADNSNMEDIDSEIIETTEVVNAPAEAEETVDGYVLMNIPYDEFYAAEGVVGVDAVTTATVKTYNTNMASGSYHEGYNAPENIKDAVILGSTYPVYVSDLSVLSGLTEVTDEDTATITVAAGKSKLDTKEVSGKDLLFASGTYAYYKLAEKPAAYKTLTVNADGSFSFSAANAEVISSEATVEVKYACHYTDLEFVIESDEISNATGESGIILTTSDGGKYALRHVENEWKRTDLGWNWSDLDGNGLSGKIITNVKYFLVTDGEYSVYSYNVNVTVKQNPGAVTAAFEDANTVTLAGLPTDLENAKATVKTKVGRGQTATVIAENVNVANGKVTTTAAAEVGTYVVTIVSDNYGDISIEAIYDTDGYVLMNIPYDEFYAAEGVADVDAVTTATVKTYNTNMASGSYHEGYDAPENIKDAAILGSTYPVYVESLMALSGQTKVTDEDTATITVAAGKSNLDTKEVSGKDLLFASGTYAYYVLTEKPAVYKTLTVNEDGSFSFSAANAEVISSEATVEVKYACHYTDLEFVIESDEINNATGESGIILTTSDGGKYALRHVENEWRRTDLGWNWSDLDGNGLSGKTITNVKYFLVTDGEYSVYSYDVNVTMKLNPGEVTAAFEDANTVTLAGLPTDLENAKATVKTKVGRGETPVVIAENVDVADGKIITTAAAEVGTYVVTIVSDNYGDISIEAVYAAPVEITEQPAAVQTVAGKKAIFRIAASGDALTYQWQYSTNGGKTWKNATATGNQTAELTVSATTGKNGYQYRCVVVNANGYTVTSDVVILSVTGITSQPTVQKVKAGKKAVFTVSAVGEELTYQWQYSTDGGKTWKNATATGNKTAKLSVSATTSKSTYKYRCVVKDHAGNTVTSNTATLYVLGIKTQPTAKHVVQGKKAIFQVTATGHNKTYQWQYSTNGGKTWKNATATGNKTAKLTVSATTGRDGYLYRCVIKDSADNVVRTNAAELHVLGITTQPTAKSVKAGATAKFKVVATGDGLTYQWQYRTSANGTWKKATATGNKTATLSVSATTGRNGYQYRCVITDAAGNTVTSNAAKLTVK